VRTAREQQGAPAPERRAGLHAHTHTHTHTQVLGPMTCGRPGHERPKCNYGGRASRARHPTCTPKKREQLHTNTWTPKPFKNRRHCVQQTQDERRAGPPAVAPGGDPPPRPPSGAQHARAGRCCAPSRQRPYRRAGQQPPFLPARARARGRLLVHDRRRSGRRTPLSHWLSLRGSTPGFGTAQRCCIDNLFEPPQQAIPAGQSCVA